MANGTAGRSSSIGMMDDGTAGDSGTFDFAAAIRADNSSRNNDEDPFLKQLRRSGEAHPEDDTKKAAFGEGGGNDGLNPASEMSFASTVENSGTFSRLTPAGSKNSLQRQSSSSIRRNQNLEAAALALADDGLNTHGGGKAGGTFQVRAPSNAFFPPPSSNNRGNTFRNSNYEKKFLQFPCGAAINNPNMMDGDNRSGDGKARGAIQGDAAASGNINPHFGQIPPNKTPMHAQKIRLQRPLFFGPYLPPRVMNEAKQIVDEALRDQWRKHKESCEQREGYPDSNPQAYTPRLGQLPSGVRNLVSAIKCYGFGLDLLPREITESDQDYCPGENSSPYVSVFCPRWSEDRKKSPSPTTVQTNTLEREKDGPNVDQGDVDQSARKYVTKDNEDGNTTTTFGMESSVGSSRHQVQEKESGEIENNSTSVSLNTEMSERDMFSAFARHGSDYNGFSHSDSAREDENDSDGSDDSGLIIPPRIRRDQRNNDNDEAPNMSEQALFTQWVHGGESRSSLNNNNTNSGGGTFQFNDSFRGMNTMISTGGGDSDDDTVVGSEMKTKVGVNEHINAALASLEEDQSPTEAIESETAADEGGGELTQVPLTKDGGRPLSNQELMNANAPLFGVDDPPLPSESDLGKHETREEEQRSKEQRRNQAFIEKLCPHNVFGPLACPNPATGPDDNHSWNSLSTPLQRNPISPTKKTSSDRRGPVANSPLGRSISSEDNSSLQTSNGYGMTAEKVAMLASSPKGYDARTRYGWWNIPNGNGADPTDSANSNESNEIDEDEKESKESPIQLPPVEHPANGYPIQTPLEPSPERLHKQNRPLSELHPATSLAHALPFISDRPPSYRYLQINTQAVAFPALTEEVEPLFCSLAIYHVETIAHNLGERGMAPVPDLERCGKVTETLNFDLIKNPDVEKSCFSCLSPYATDETNESSRLTTCGVFPLPSNLSVNNLYAIITVGKVISEGSDFEPYLRAKPKIKDEQTNIENLRLKAERASINHGNFIMPFAFGVAPLLQVFGADIPRVPSSRAVQIPLFRFYAGNGERQIIDHIMVMLYPRADHRASGIGGPAPLTNGGTAMLVMRNFGYLGLHEVVNGKSSLAMDRLIDFTGEMQLRRRDDDEREIAASMPCATKYGPVPAWRSEYMAEPTINGGRCTKPIVSRPERSYSALIAQEIAPVPMHNMSLGRAGSSPHIVPKSRARVHSSCEDIEPYFHTTFCNELLCYPRLLHNCQKGNIVIKVELRDIEWNAEYGVFLAHMPSSGPVVHNRRRGPFLVQGAYTSCTARRPDPHFLDEFKLKLPLLLGSNESRSASILFTVYRLSFSSKKKWGLRGLGKKRPTKKFDEITGDMVGENDVVTGKDCQLIQLGCGFLPLEKKHSLLENGTHDVRISYVAKHPLQEFCDKEGLNSDTLVMSDFTIGKGDSVAGDESLTEEGDSQGSERYYDTLSAASASERDMVLSENMDDNKMKQLRKVVGMLLQVRISVQSSVHSQNATLNEFLCQEPDVNIPLKSAGNETISFLRSGKDAILRQLRMSSFLTLPEEVQYETKKLLISTVDLAKPEMCSVADISLHLVRVCKQLWKVVVIGTGYHDLNWANPAANIPLRVNAFATLLQILGSSTLYLSRRGVTQLDGKDKFNLLTLSRVMGLLFDEKEMFGNKYHEVVSNEFLSALAGIDKNNKSSIRRESRGHIRSTCEFGHGSDGVGAIINGTHSNSSEVQGLTSHRNDIVKSRTPPMLTEVSDGDNLIRKTENQRIETVEDFKKAVQASNNIEEDEALIIDTHSSGNETADAWLKAFRGSSGGGHRRWMTAPAQGLSTIREDSGDGKDHRSNERKGTKGNQGPLDSLDTEIVRNTSKNRKQYRIPTVSTKLASNNKGNSLDFLDESRGLSLDNDQSIDTNTGVRSLSTNSSGRNIAGKGKKRLESSTLPSTDADMLKAGTSFLDAIEKSLGIGPSFSSNQPQEENDRVFGKYHRKTVSHSSIDWSIPNDDLSNLLSRSKEDKMNSMRAQKIENIDESMTTLSQEFDISLKMPNFADRLVALGETESQYGRWFPYTYEIIIMQWATILMEQQRYMVDPINCNRQQNETVVDAASRTIGYIVACAPILLEIIKQSIGERITHFTDILKRKSKYSFPPLVTLDDGMLTNLEQLISMITDLCLDSRNFDTYETRLSCVNVNDSITCFLRDMFAFLNPACVYRLTMIYMSRLIARDGLVKDSKIGLDIAHEIKKLQMNAISAFVRFPDFVKVNSPQMNSWTNTLTLSPDLSTAHFFDNILELYGNLGLQSILSYSKNQVVELPQVRPHWMAETIVDICFSGIEHKEPNIQSRSASLLLELFWSQSQRSLKEGYSPIVASMYITFIEKVLLRTSHLSSFSPKDQVRRDVILCLVFVLQSAPPGLLRAVWRKLFKCTSGKEFSQKNGGSSPAISYNSLVEANVNEVKPNNVGIYENEESNIYDMFGLLNLCLATVEYEGSDEHAETDGITNDDPLGFWSKGFLMTREHDTLDSARRKRMLFMMASFREKDTSNDEVYGTTSSRKWLSHDASIAIIRTAQQIVRELRCVLEPLEGSQSLFNPARRKAKVTESHRYNSNTPSLKSTPLQISSTDVLKFTYSDTIIFVRGATSVYLNSLVLRESDIAVVKTLNASVEIIKIFGIKIFNEAVGETLQHWLRIITYHCGSRRAEVRVPASDFAELILRSTWDCFGSFFRIRIPLLAVQTEVMQRIVAIATARYYRDQRKTGIKMESFSNACAEASLTPLWRTTDRLHHQSASQNVAFRSSLVRLAEKIKKLHRAYIAAHALSHNDLLCNTDTPTEIDTNDVESLKRANRINVIRVVNASAGYSKQFLGFQVTARSKTRLAHHEALEDALLDAADVFSPTELPDHRVIWLRKLAQFHANRSKNAEEATCHYMIYYTLNRSSRLNWSSWCSAPFLPWVDNLSDGVNLGCSIEPDNGPFYATPSLGYGRQHDKPNPARRVSYSDEISVRLNAAEFRAGARNFAFFGVSLPMEYFATTPWISHREMEANMLEEAEAAGRLFQKSGIITSSRYMWGLAAQYYAQKFMYGKLTHVYDRLARTVVTQVPNIDNTLEQAVNVGIPLGRFYRVWFHGGAPDELIATEFVYRTRTKMSLTKFGKELRGVLRSIIPDKTPIHLVLDGRPDESVQTNPAGFIRMGGAPLDPVKVKVTPLRPVVRNECRIRGLPEWFKHYISSAFRSQSNSRITMNENSFVGRNGAEIRNRRNGHHQLHHSRSYGSMYHASIGHNAENSTANNFHEFEAEMDGVLVGVEKFWYTQSMNKYRSRSSRDWLKGASDDFADKTIRVTQLQVRQAFPACVSRQKVIHRDVYSQSPLEAAVDNLCLWCAVLFRTLISSNGSTVLGSSNDPGIGIEAAKVVSECIHSSRVKEIGTVLLRKYTRVRQDDDDVLQSFDRLTEDEVQIFQLKLARSLVVFMELLHLLIARNRDLLLKVVQKRKRDGSKHPRDLSQSSMHRVVSRGEITLSANRTPSRSKSRRGSDPLYRHPSNGHNIETAPSREDSSVRTSSTEDHDQATVGSSKDASNEKARIDPSQRTDSAIGIQRELQLAFINIAKDLWPMIHGIMESDTPDWLKECCQDNYFSKYTYRDAKIPMGEEFTFEDANPSGNDSSREPATPLPSKFDRHTSLSSYGRSDKSYISHQSPDSPGGSIGSNSNVSRGSDANRSLMSARSQKERSMV
eukprot:CAMPEP_0197181318 /NCGR_PEP_ID=MMETSP1423-20130617/5641_1 /TAXON_ID=476441 /ORGANISM="Pseudo-nitzschia heimii, Strain UNC1101" /LENGTH=3706 /DNA_ID=CAMNT_0042631551 /DNA_START=249 /DNA_END=11369 /DNA_ORIENTATION=-